MAPGFLFGTMTMLLTGGGCTTLNILKIPDSVHLNMPVVMVCELYLYNIIKNQWAQQQKMFSFRTLGNIQLYTPPLLVILFFNLKILNTLKLDSEGAFFPTNLLHFTGKLTDTGLRK